MCCFQVYSTVIQLCVCIYINIYILYVCLCVYIYTHTYAVLSHFSRVLLFVTPWTVARQAPLSMGILQARTLEWDAMPSSRRSSRPRDQTLISCTADRFFTAEPPGKHRYIYSYICIFYSYIYILYVVLFNCSIIHYHRILSIVSYAIQ